MQLVFLLFLNDGGQEYSRAWFVDKWFVRLTAVNYG